MRVEYRGTCPNCTTPHIIEVKDIPGEEPLTDQEKLDLPATDQERCFLCQTQFTSEKVVVQDEAAST